MRNGVASKRLQHMDRCEQPPVIGIVGGGHESKVNIATLEAIRNAGAAIFDQIDIHRGVSAPISW